MEREVRNDRHMTDVEAMMWNVEKDPFLSSTFGALTILDQPPDPRRLRLRVQRLVTKIPRFRQRVAPVLGRLAPPEWQDDPDFDLDYHLRHLALPAPGSWRQLLDLATLVVADPFDRTRPLWEFVVVDGLEGGRAAMIQKIHHTITDGEGGIRMSEQFIDLERDAPDPDPADLVPTGGSHEARHDPLPTAAGEALSHSARRALGAANRAAGNVHGLLRDPGRLARLPPDVLDTARSTVRQVTVSDHARSPLWTRRSLRRHLDTIDVPFDDAYAAAKALGGSLNDLFVAGAAAGAGAYHRELGAPVEELRMAMPISTRSDRSAAGNAFVPARVLVPTAALDPAERVQLVHETLHRTKGERALAMAGTFAGLVNLLPTSVVVRFARQQTETVDFTTSNLRAAPFDLFIAGARLEGNYPMGPLGGTAFNLTMMSYRGQLNLGLHVDRGAIEDPERLRHRLCDAYDELLDAGARTSARSG